MCLIFSSLNPFIVSLPIELPFSFFIFLFPLQVFLFFSTSSISSSFYFHFKYFFIIYFFNIHFKYFFIFFLTSNISSSSFSTSSNSVLLFFSTSNISPLFICLFDFHFKYSFMASYNFCIYITSIPSDDLNLRNTFFHPRIV